jgi:hypothetical protein
MTCKFFQKKKQKSVSAYELHFRLKIKSINIIFKKENFKIGDYILTGPFVVY